MITGYDTVLITGAPVDAGIRVMLDDLHGRWPNMVVALGGDHVGPFLPWRTTRAQVPAGAGEVYIARDAEMERRWDDLGYSLMEHAEGPFAVLYQSASQLAVEIQLNDDPYERRGFGFELYPATLVTAGLSLVTLVTPDMDSPFSQSLLHALRQALISRAGG
ncbi:hypothetical protein [Verrucosispora sioxanthis]|uniref:Uncharacterized protein n=1 Tax=Verrucosispora sioxanthis TaxID=2499994 RepID=A0A6M1KYX8_9ACTN|nr:hypothetical protein [Verrucosispora sioxanthis]NEE65056.1 hypothetical protein [Verrucosispora sioxanthis]NGM14166.1 hypothetical protein [Verrucosispora sioxanthis]